MHRLNLDAIEKLADFLCSKMYETAPEHPRGETGLVLMDDETIVPVNQRCFARNQPTDVISLTYNTDCDQDDLIGEVLVNVQRAHQIGDQHHGRDYELAFYIAHGFLHQTGAEDDTPARRARMHRTQAQWLTEAHERNINLTLFARNNPQKES